MASKQEPAAGRILGSLARRYGTATVLLHHAVGGRVGLGPTDHKCLDLLLERGPLTASQLATLTGLTTGALSGVVARLERDGRIGREPDPHDGRRQLLSVRPDGNQDLVDVFAAIDLDRRPIVDGFDRHQLDAVEQFLERATELAYQRIALLRSDVVLDHARTRTTTAGT